MCDPILVTPLKMRPHDSQSSRENATPSSGTSPLASYKEVHPPPGSTYFMHQSFESPAPPPIRALAGDGGGGAFTSDTPHVGSLVGGEFAGSHGLRIPSGGISGALIRRVLFLF